MKSIRHCCNISLLFLLYSCHDIAGQHGISFDIDEAKLRNVYVAEYELRDSLYNFNDSIIIRPEKVWIEKQWKYGSDYNLTIIKNSYQIVIINSSNSLLTDVHGLNAYYSIVLDDDRYLRTCSDNCLIGDLGEVYPDTLVYKVKQGPLSKQDDEDRVFLDESALVFFEKTIDDFSNNIDLPFCNHVNIDFSILK